MEFEGVRVLARHRGWAALLALLLAAGCGEPPPAGGQPDPSEGHGYALTATGGVYSDGSGRLGVAVLATLRDAEGLGPSSPWSGTLADAAGVVPGTLVYDAPGTGSWSAWWWPEVAPGGEYTLALSPDGTSPVRAEVAISSGAGLTVPLVELSADASTLQWASIDGAAGYACEVRAGETAQLSQRTTGTTCDVSSLPPGAYAASVFAFSADPAVLASATTQRPPLAPFHVSEGRISFLRPSESEPPIRLLAAGGAYDDGLSAPSLAVWVSISQTDGLATPERWDVTVVGPGLPTSAPLQFSYWANFPRLMVWTLDAPAAAGTYSLTATSASGTAAARFTIGNPGALDMPTGLEASADAQGAASMTWTGVEGARSYLVSVYDAATGELAASQWVGETRAAFPQGSFVPGRSYDTFIAASDADMVGGTPPLQFTVAENALGYDRFTAR